MAEPTPTPHDVTRSGILIWYGENLRKAPVTTAALTAAGVAVALGALWALQQMGLLALVGL